MIFMVSPENALAGNTGKISHNNHQGGQGKRACCQPGPGDRRNRKNPDKRP